ncbi:hypothetical protein BDZ89DRAFT_1072069 [Hymenopellis radicata]|nr:hypothetical protein BDZ89DRAFT_1072069 [Hymenopellis radicata]
MSSILPAITARPLQRPLPLLDTNSRVSVYHPKVPFGVPILLLNAFPCEPGSGVVGVPVGLVLDACFVLAGNQRGELRLLASQQERVAGDDSDPDGLLVPGMYQFVVVRAGGYAELDYDYHLCESFAAWTPPVAVPPRWLGGEAARAPPLRPSPTSVCIMTGAATALQASHLVPEAESEWSHFLDLTSVRNEVALRADLNAQGFEQGLFLFAPYAGHVVAVFVKAVAQDLAYKYHLRAVDFPSRIRRGYLFVPFLKRKRPDSPADRSHGGGGARKQEDVAGGSGGGNDEDRSNGDGSLLTDDDNEALLVLFEKLDEVLKTRPLTVDDEQAGRYPGFSRIKRLELEYRRAHPQVSAEGDDE